MSAAVGKVILVVGMHRSGTSAATRVLNLLGVELGSRLLPAAGDNASGFWEHHDAVLIHEQLLNDLGRKWFDLRELPSGWLTTSAAADARLRLKELFAREFSGARIWAVKDPRICRLLPLWLSVLDELRVKAHALFIVRHPNEVAQSLQARDGIPVSRSVLSWAQHMAEAEISSRGIPRSVLMYDDLLMNWESSMGRVAVELDIRWPNDATAVDNAARSFLEPAARHYSVDNNTTAKLPRLVQKIYNAFVSVAHGTAPWSAVSSLSDIYDDVANSFLAPLDDFGSRKDEGHRQVSGEDEASIAALFRKFAVRLAAMEEYIAYDKVIDDVAKLYFRATDQSHSEDRVIVVRHDGLWAGRQINFELPVGTVIDFLRFDPSENGGVFNIFELRLDDTVLEHPERHVTAANQCLLAPGPGGSLRLSSTDNDPYVEFALGSIGASVTAGTCTVGVRRESLHGRMLDAYAAAMRSAISELGIAEVDRTQAVLESLQRAVESIRDRWATFDRLQAGHLQQLEELGVGQREMKERLQTMNVHVEDGRVQAEELKELQRGLRDRELKHEAEIYLVREAIAVQSEEITRHEQALFGKLQAHHYRQLEELELHKCELLQQLEALKVQVEGGRGQMEALMDFQRGMREREAAFKAEVDSLREAVISQSASISSLSKNAAASHEAMRFNLDILVGAHERTLLARWHQWMKKRRH